MNQFVKWPFDGTKITFQAKIIDIIQKANAWFFISENGEKYGPFKIVATSCPAPQIKTITPTFDDELGKVKYDRCLVINLRISKSGIIKFEQGRSNLTIRLVKRSVNSSKSYKINQKRRFAMALSISGIISSGAARLAVSAVIRCPN